MDSELRKAPVAVSFPPSLSPQSYALAAPPRLIHTLHQQDNSVLSLSADDFHLFSGSQSFDILVWDKQTYTLKGNLRGHKGSVLALEYAEDKKWLFSASGDSTIRVWSIDTLTPLYVMHPHLETGAGDLFSLAWSPTLQTIYIGCQNTSLQWFDFEGHTSLSAPGSGLSTPTLGERRFHKFFDSGPRFGLPPDVDPAPTPPQGRCNLRTRSQLDTFHVPPTNVVDSAHYGYVYCLALVPSANAGTDHENVYLVSGSGDETMKLWDCSSKRPTLQHTFDCGSGAVLSLVARSETIYAGCQDGYVKVWDLHTKTLVRILIVQEGADILSLTMLDTDLYACTANGQVQCWSASFLCTASWQAHDGHIVLSSVATKGAYDSRLVTGGNDGCVKVWSILLPQQQASGPQLQIPTGHVSGAATDDTLIYALTTFVSIPSISSEPSHREDCRQAAIFLKKCFSQLGAESALLPVGDGRNPLVHAVFKGTEGIGRKPRVLFYGHYDVISAPQEGWISNPFTLTGRNGYLYGRGVTDDKGPIMAVAFAAAELLSRRTLGIDLTLLIEGEEEVGSAGFKEAVDAHKDLFGQIDAILISNSTWIAEEPPCITYGLRGVVHCVVKISSGGPDLHSGIQGGAAVEPMADMIELLATLADHQRRILIPGFYDSVRQQTEEEMQLYEQLSIVAKQPASVLSSRWREPSLTVHNVKISGPDHSTVIPSTVSAQVSIRIVPDQDLRTITESLCSHLRTSFESFGTPNKLEVSIEHTADWWLGSLDDPYFKCLEKAVQEEWGVKPLRIREGGSIPSVPCIEKEFGCQAVHLPLGQSSDQAHLPNERISLPNLFRGKSVVERFILNVSDIAHQDSA